MENDLECVALDNQSQKLNKTIRKNKLQIKIMAIVLSVLFIFITAFVVLGMIAESVYFYTGVEGSSMKPTINASAQDSKQAYDHVYVNTYQKGTYNDIIVIEHTGRGGDVKKVIKRLIAMGEVGKRHLYMSISCYLAQYIYCILVGFLLNKLADFVHGHVHRFGTVAIVAAISNCVVDTG